LLIVGMLSPVRLAELMELARRFWLQCLVEVHDEEELGAALDAGAEIVGINNRDLRTFETDLAVTERLAGLIPSGKIIVSESGIHGREDIRRVGEAGAHAVLIGEALVTATDPGAKLRELL
jgi:indole-3-glycerol phosphate synthase